MGEGTLQKCPPSIAVECLGNVIGNGHEKKMVCFTLPKPGISRPVAVTGYSELAAIS